MEASYTYKHFFKKNFPTKSTTTLGSTIWIKKIHYGARSPPKKNKLAITNLGLKTPTQR